MLPFCEQDQLNLRERVRAWVKKNLISAHGPLGDVEAEAQRIAHRLAQEKFFTYAVPDKFGGKREQVQARDLCILREELARGDALADTMFAMQALGSYPITLAGTEKQRQKYLPNVASGRAIAAFALTEPEAGSDVASLQTTAIKQGTQYSLNGIKRFISNAGIADYYVVFVVTAPEQKTKGVSAFIVDAATPGLTVTEKTALLSPHPIGTIAFENCMVPETAVLGQEGDGLKIAFETLDLLRCTVGAAAVGFAQRALEEAIDYSSSRRQFGRAIGEFQGIQFKLAELATELEAARLLVYQAAWAHDCGGKELKQKSSMAKLFATEAAQRIIDQALQIHGGVGLVRGNIMERLYRDVRALRIYEGTSEIQKLVIARELLKQATDSKQ
jgi:acyl-CoA dehydrogenase